MAKRTIPCPQCNQPIAADITRLFDVREDPQAKQILLSGAYNLVQCPHCGYQGQAPSPIVYHDPEKELLLTYFPSELHVPVNQQEQMIGPIIKGVLENLPNELRKAYLFKPETMLTRQRMMERILEEDGITPEMLKAQQERLNFLQRLARTSPDARVDVIKQEEALVDEELFMILQRLIQSAAQAGEEESAQVLVGLQQDILENTEYGQEILKTSQEQQAAVKALEEASKKGLTRESLLDLILEAADSDIKLATMVSMARGGLDYAFFQLLSERIEKFSGEKRAELTALREQLLEMTHEIDQAVKAQEKLVNQALDDILGADDIEEATLQAMPVVNEIFLEVLRHRIKHARDDENQAALEKLQKVSRTIQKVSAPGANIDLIEALIQAENEAAVNEILEENSDEITDDFMQFLMNLLNQTQGQQGVEQTAEKLQQIYRQVLRFSMKRNLEAQA